MAVDIAKNTFQLWGVNSAGRCVFKKKVSRSHFLPALAKLKTCTVVMEACGGANHWSREITRTLEHEVKLISAQFVKPYVKTNKNDLRDAEAIAEAASRPNMRFVSPKSLEQQDWQSLLRMRDHCVSTRTRLSNHLRGLMTEYGVVLPQGIAQLRKALPSLIAAEADNGLTPMIKALIASQYEQLLALDEMIKAYTRQIDQLGQQHDVLKRLQTIPGVGPITALSLYVIGGNGSAFKNGRHFAAFLGLVPRQHSSGGREKHLGISKRGDGHTRKVLVHGARAALKYAKHKNDQQSRWVMSLAARKHVNTACVALANKNARIAWAILRFGDQYRVQAA